jgi:nitroreductase
MARLSPSARNIQPLEYIIVDSRGPLKEMFPCMGFGGLVEDFSGKEPMVYVVVLVNKSLVNDWTKHDCGLAVENLLLAAWEKGIASCILARINRKKIRALLKIPDNYEIELVVTMGYPAERPVAFDSDDMAGFTRDAKGVLRVPKRRLRKILHRNKF